LIIIKTIKTHNYFVIRLN